MVSDKSLKATGKNTYKDSLYGEKLYQIRARKAFPILARQAKAEQTIYYSDLANEMRMPNARNLNYPLGAIGNAILRLNKEKGSKIPPVQFIVINKQNEMPGKGIEWFIPKREKFKRSSKRQKRLMWKEMLQEVYQYDDWDNVLEEFDLKPLKPKRKNISKAAFRKFRKYGRGGESEGHKGFKNYIANNPHQIDLQNGVLVDIEFTLPSADAIDVLFRNGNELIGVEVKATNSSIDDIERGIYQCVKYQALLEAVQMASQQKPNATTLLVIEGEFPASLIALKNTLGVEVKEVVK